MFNAVRWSFGKLVRAFLGIPRKALREKGKFQVPKNYFPDDDPKQDPINRWRSHAHLLYGNWINEIYQTTPFEIEKIGLK